MFLCDKEVHAYKFVYVHSTAPDLTLPVINDFFIQVFSQLYGYIVRRWFQVFGMFVSYRS